MGLKKQPPPGTKVRLTAHFLASTGQRKGSEGSGRWLTEACKCGLCAGGRHVAVNEPLFDGARDPTRAMYSDIPREEQDRMRRHFAIANLEIVGAPPKAEDYELPIVSRRTGR